MYKGDTILVTGAGGFIGANVVRRLVEEGYCVSVLVKKDTDLWRLEFLKDRLHFVFVSLLDKEELKTVMKTLQPKGIFHFAASNIASGVTAGDRDVVSVNLLGTKNLIDSVAQIEYSFFVQTGSFMEVGPKDHPICENDLSEPTELYSITKLGATLYGQSVGKQQGKPIVTIRLFTPYGSLMQAGRLVFELIQKSLANESIQLSVPTITRDFIFIDDIVALCMNMMDSAKRLRGEIFNCGSGIATTMGDVVNEVIQLTGSSSIPEWGRRPVLAYDGTVWQADTTKVFRETSWRPRVTLTEGLQKTIAWVKEYQKNI